MNKITLLKLLYKLGHPFALSVFCLQKMYRRVILKIYSIKRLYILYPSIHSALLRLAEHSGRTDLSNLKRYRKKYYLILSMLTILNSISADIIESNTLEAVLDYISTRNVLVIFDIDNTIARPITELGSDEWFCDLVNKRMEEGHDYITAVYYALPATFYAQFNIPLEATEEMASSLITYLKDQQIPVMALTTRSLFVAERTMEQLEDIGIAFLVPHISQEDLVLQMPHPCLYRESILFGGNNDKGEALITFFHWMNYYPDAVIFIDDKLKHLSAVEKVLKHYNIPFIGIRYSGCDDLIKNFDPAIAETQWQQLRQKRNYFHEK